MSYPLQDILFYLVMGAALVGFFLYVKKPQSPKGKRRKSLTADDMTHDSDQQQSGDSTHV